MPTYHLVSWTKKVSTEKLSNGKNHTRNQCPFHATQTTNDSDTKGDKQELRSCMWVESKSHAYEQARNGGSHHGNAHCFCIDSFCIYSHEPSYAFIIRSGSYGATQISPLKKVVKKEYNSNANEEIQKIVNGNVKIAGQFYFSYAL